MLPDRRNRGAIPGPMPKRCNYTFDDIEYVDENDRRALQPYRNER